MAQYKNNHKRRRKLRRKLAQKRKLDRQTKPIAPIAGDVTKYFQQYDPRNKRHQHYVFVPIPRVSHTDQLENYSLEEQFWTMRKYAFENHLKLYPIDHRIQCSSMWRKESKEFFQKNFEKYPKSCPNPKIYKPHYEILKDIVHRVWLSKEQNPTVKYALLFLSVNRALRSDKYSKYNKDAKLISEELGMFLSVTKPFPSFVICNPLWSDAEVDSWRKEYGVVIESEQPRQRGDLKREYDKKHDKSIELQLEDISHRDISEQLGVPIERIRSWWLKSPKYRPKN